METLTSFTREERISTRSSDREFGAIECKANLTRDKKNMSKKWKCSMYWES